MGKAGKFKQNSATFKEILTGAPIQGILRGIGEATAARANTAEGTPNSARGESYGFEVRSIGSPHTRAGSRVVALGPTARRRNRENNTLNKSIGG